MWLETFTLSVTALFAGAALYVGFVEHPARLSCGSAAALAEWRPSYQRGTLMQAPLAIVAALFGLACWWKGGGWLWLVAALLIGSVVPFTLLVIFPTNHRLKDPSLDGASDEARQLLTGWGRLHAVRTALSSAALAVIMVASASG